MSDEKLNMIKNYKFTEDNTKVFESALKGLHEKPMDAELGANGEYKVTIPSLLEKIIDIGLLNLELNIAFMKNALATHIEHELETEIMNTKMEDKLNQAMTAMGLDPDKTKKLFGGDSGR